MVTENHNHDEGCGCALCAEGHEHDSFDVDADILSATINEGVIDASSNVNTNKSMNVGDTFNGVINSNDSSDWVSIDLVAGQAYDFSLTGVSLSDTVLYLYDANGTLIASNDDIAYPTNTNSALTYTAGYTGEYFLVADAFGSFTGSYSLSASVSTAAPLTTYTNDQIVTQLTDDFWDWSNGGSSAAPYSWDVAPGGSIDVYIGGLSADGQTLADAALDVWTLVTGIDFNRMGSAGAADMVFAESDAANNVSSSDVTAYAGFQSGFDTTIDSANIVITQGWLSSQGNTIDSYGFQTYIHEIGHALGLGHGGNYNGSATYGVDNNYLNDSWQASVMSYFSQTENTNIIASRAYVMTPMIADILAMQALYGTATNLRTGDTTYGEGSNAGGMYDDLLNYTSTALTFTIVDNGGIDTLAYSSTSADQVVDLNDESISSMGGLIGNVSIARGTFIENFISGSGDDTITGNEFANTIVGGAGADSMDGGAGIDFVSFAGASAGVTMDMLFGGVVETGDATGDSYTNFEGVIGSDHDDILGGTQSDNTFEGGAGNDTLNGYVGDDYFIEGAGADYSNGGSGFRDHVDYGNATGAVQIGVNDGAVNTGDIAQGDTYRGIEDLTGGDFGDEITGNSVQNILVGGDGDDYLNGSSNTDTIYGGEGNDTLLGSRGADILYGGEGEDLAWYTNADQRVTLSLVTGTATGSGQGAGDTLVDIEHVYGSRFHDDFTGNDGDNSINGYLGNDIINGGGGNDTLHGSAGNDTLNGGEGNDTLIGASGEDVFVFSDTDWGDDEVSHWQDGVDMLDFTALGLSYADFTVTNVGGNTVLTNGGNSVTIAVDPSQIDQFDFV